MREKELTEQIFHFYFKKFNRSEKEIANFT